jgi:hypothetical protein
MTIYFIILTQSYFTWQSFPASRIPPKLKYKLKRNHFLGVSYTSFQMTYNEIAFSSNSFYNKVCIGKWEIIAFLEMGSQKYTIIQLILPHDRHGSCQWYSLCHALAIFGPLPNHLVLGLLHAGNCLNYYGNIVFWKLKTRY